jgi:sugar lactone lactonase YvrE
MKKILSIYAITLLILGCNKQLDTSTVESHPTKSPIPVKRNLRTGAVMVSTIAGTGNAGYVDGPAKRPRFHAPTSVVLDALGNIIVADWTNNAIRKIAPSGDVTTIAGNGVAGYVDGSSAIAQFNGPYGVAIDQVGNILVADAGNQVIRKITPSGVVSTIAGSTQGLLDGNALTAQFNQPVGIAIDASGNLLIVEYGNHDVRKISTSGIVSTVAGNGSFGYVNGIGTAAQFSFPTGIAIDLAGNIIVADNDNRCVRKINTSGVVSTITGSPSLNGSQDGALNTASFSGPSSVAIDASNNIYLVESVGSKVRKINQATSTVSTISGDFIGFADGNTLNALFNVPTGITLDGSGNLLIADRGNNAIRKISAGIVSTVAGDGNYGLQDGNTVLPLAKFNYTADVCQDSYGNLIVCDKFNNRIRKISPSGIVSTLPGIYNSPNSVAVDPQGNIIVGDWTNIKKISPSGVVTTMAGGTTTGYQDGFGTAARFNIVTGLFVHPNGYIYFGDNSRVIRSISPSGYVNTIVGSATTSAGFQDGFGVNARFNDPFEIAIDNNGDLIITDFLNRAIRKLNLSNNYVSTITGTTFLPIGVAVDAQGNIIFGGGDYGATGEHKICKYMPGGRISVIAGSTAGYVDGPAINAKFFQPMGLFIDNNSDIVIADGHVNCSIRKITGAW